MAEDLTALQATGRRVPVPVPVIEPEPWVRRRDVPAAPPPVVRVPDPPLPPPTARDWWDPPAMLLMCSPAFAPWLLDTQLQKIPAGAAGTVLTMQSSGIAAWGVPGAVGGVDWVNVVSQFGADNTGVTDASTAIANAIGSLPNSGGVVYFPAGTYKIAQAGTVLVKYTAATTGAIYLLGDGIDTTTLAMTAPSAGDCVRFYNSVFPSSGFTSLQVYGGGISGMTIDGASSVAGSVGLHIGDCEYVQVDVKVQNFLGTGAVGPAGNGSAGVWWDNEVFWTNLARARIFSLNNQNAVVFDVHSGHPDNYYNDFYINIYAVPSAPGTTPGQNGITHQNNWHETNSRLKVAGIFNTNSVASSSGGVAFTMTGSSTHLLQCELDVALDTQKAGTVSVPQTINLAAGCYFGRCYGRLNFTGQPAWTSSNITGTSQSAQFTFVGPVEGDTSLAPGSAAAASAGYPVDWRVGSPVLYAQNLLNGSTGQMYDASGDFFACTLSASMTVGLGQTGAGSVGGAQRKTLRIKQAASGGPYTVTWPHTGSPSTTSPTVLWAGGTAPVMTVTANAVDYYFLETLDGATWVGRAAQNVS